MNYRLVNFTVTSNKREGHHGKIHHFLDRLLSTLRVTLCHFAGYTFSSYDMVVCSPKIFTLDRVVLSKNQNKYNVVDR